MMDKTIVLIESSCVGAEYTADAAYSLGFTPVFLTHPDVSQGETREQILKYDHIECDTYSLSDMNNAVKDIKNIELVTSLSDTSLTSALSLGHKLKCKTLDPTIESLKDKGIVYNTIPEYSPLSIPFTIENIPLNSIQNLVEKCGTVIVKPTRAAGGVGVVSISCQRDVMQLPKLLSDLEVPKHFSPNLWIAQGFVKGELVSLEGYVDDSSCRFLGFSGRKKIGMTESIIIFPWDQNISREAAEDAKEAVVKLVERSGFSNGYFHVEFIVSDQKAYLIDSNIGRIGGGGLTEQIGIAFGIDFEKIHRHILSLSIKEQSADEIDIYQNKPILTWSVMYGIPVRAKLEKVIVPEYFGCSHTRILNLGDNVQPMGTDNYAWIGIVSGEPKKIEAEIINIKILTSEGEFSPIY